MTLDFGFGAIENTVLVGRNQSFSVNHIVNLTDDFGMDRKLKEEKK